MRTEDNFADVSTISGADDIADGRSFSLIDYNNDGWQDIALMSLSKPRFKLLKNNMGKVYPDRHQMQIKLIGGHHASNLDGAYSNRDAIGARVRISFENRPTLMLHRQSGEGFASQNSSKLAFGTKKGEQIKSIRVEWPNGGISTIEAKDLDLKDRLITIREDADED